MAISSLFNGTNVTTAESTTNWDNATITAAELWTEILKQGSGSIGFQASNKDGYGAYDYSGTGSFNFDTTHLGQHVFYWVNFTTPGTLEAIATGGMYLIVGSDSNNYKKFLISAKDAQEQIGKGFGRFVLDPTKTATETIGTPDMTAIDFFGVWVDTDLASRADNLFIDRIDVGFGLKITGTSTQVWKDIVDDDALSANKYGILQEEQGVYFAYGQIQFGDTTQTANTSLSDIGRKIQFVSQQYYNGTVWVDLVADDFFKISVADNATYSTQFTDGIIVGTDNGRSGSLISGSVLHNTTIDFSGLVHVSSYTKLYNTKLEQIFGGVKLTNSISNVFYGGVLNESGQLNTGGSNPILRNITFSGTKDSYGGVNPDGSALLWYTGMDIKDCSFIANTDVTYNPHAIQHDTAESVTYDGLSFSGNDFDLHFTAATGDLIVAATNGSNPATSEVVGTGSVTINNAVIIEIKGVYTGSEPTNYVRCHIEALTGGPESVGTVLLNDLADVADGSKYKATASYNYSSDQPVIIRARYKGFLFFEATGTITTAGLSITAIWIVNDLFNI